MRNTKKFNWERWLESKEECEKSFNRYRSQKTIKEESEKEYLSKSHLEKTDYNLRFINYLLETKVFYDWIITGCYYAIYQASLALLSNKGYSSKNHNATINALIHLYYSRTFNLKEEKDSGLKKEDIELISKSSIEKEEVNYFVEAKNKRETASYGISEEFKKNEAEELKDKTIKFVNKVKEILEKT